MAHLHAILATESPVAVLIKRGPGRCTGILRWDRRSDTFEHGQWLKLNFSHCGADLSPDGALFVYYVETHNPNREHAFYRAISRPPWLKALAFWSTKSWIDGPGTGMFVHDRSHTLKLYASAHKPVWDKLGIKTVDELPAIPPWNAIAKGPLLWTRLQRDGWIVTVPYEPNPWAPSPLVKWHGTDKRTPTLERSLTGGWTLRQQHGCRSGVLHNQPIASESFALVAPDGEPVPKPAWEWADYDTPRKRIVWTAGRMLFAAPWTTAGPGGEQVLFDANGLGFVRREAPY
jgi:hypothetical protein